MFESGCLAQLSHVVIAVETNSLFREFRIAVERGLGKAIAGNQKVTSEMKEDFSILLTALIDGIGLQILIEPDLAGRDGLWKELESMVLSVLRK